MEKIKPLLLVEALAAGNDSGLGNMTRLFVDGLRGLAGTADIMVILPRAGAYKPPPGFRFVSVTAKPLRVWTQLSFPLLIKRVQPAAVLCLGQNLPWWRPAAKYALAIADAGPLEDLGWPTSSHDPYNRRWLRRMAPKADAIVAISEFTKARLISLLGLPADRIRVVRPIRPLRWESGTGSPGGVAAAPVAEGGPATGGHPPGDYFLALGNIEPRKNFPGLIAAYALLKKKHPDAPPLYIAGHKAWGYGETASAIARHGLAASVRLTGYLSDADRRAYLVHCRVYVASSLYEGWGLPLFEALAEGKPAIYHAGSSQEEFARGSALAVDCRDPGRLAEAMETLWTDTAARDRLAADRAERFPGILTFDLEASLSAALRPLLGTPD